MITIIDTVRIATIGSPGPQGPSAQATSVVVMSDDATSVTLAVGSYALVSEGTNPYPHIVIRSEFA